jgi:uncharacterized tellurite resistance protein B-like protein
MLASLKNFLREQFALAEQPDHVQEKHSLELATAVLAIEIARADEAVADEERHHIAEMVSSHFRLTGEEARKIVELADEHTEQAVSLYDFTRTLNDTLNYEERIEIIRLLWEVAWSDSRIHKYEEYYIRKIADLLYVSHGDYIRTKLAVEEKRQGDDGK